MKATLPLFALLLAANQHAPGVGAPDAIDRAPLFQNDEGLAQLRPNDNCTDTIQQVRAERGLPLLRREPVEPGRAILFRAVDHHVDGCDVLLAMDGQILPLPLPLEGPLRPQPAQ